MAERLKFALFGNIYQAKKSASVKQLISLLAARDTDFYTYLSQELHFDVCPTGLISDSDFQADIAVSMGGDGTFLAAASRVGNKDIPILGINMGRLGFLADVSPEEIKECIDDIYNHTYKIDERSVIEVKYEGHAHGFHRLCLERRRPHHRAPIRYILHYARSLPQPERTSHHAPRPSGTYAIGRIPQP